MLLDGAQGVPRASHGQTGDPALGCATHSPPSMSRRDLCAGELFREVVDSGFKARLDPGPHPEEGQRGSWGLYCGPAAWPEVVGDRMASLTSSRGALESEGSGAAVSAPQVLRPDPGFLCGSGHRPAVSGLFSISNPDWVHTPGPDTV